jgi:putative hydrolase of the HAD superfamily
LEKNAELWHLYHYGKIEKDFLVTERFRYTLEKIGAKGNLEEMSKEIDEEYLRFLAEQKNLVPGALRLLEYLNERYDVHALSNGFKGIQQRKLESAGVRHLIDKVIISDDCGVTKPLRGIFDYALQQCGAEAESTVMIGDNMDADICGAVNAGWSAIYFDIKNMGKCENADASVSTLEDVIGLL